MSEDVREEGSDRVSSGATLTWPTFGLLGGESRPHPLVCNLLPRKLTLEHSRGIWRLLCAA